jgi:ATP-dependent DNA helicase DinG
VATLEHLLQAAVAGVGGATRPGQQQMANAVAEAIHSRSHLLVQAGTGTGKSLAYLVPAVQHAVDTGRPVVVATATIALQAQIVDRDLPRLAAALAPCWVVGRPSRWSRVGATTCACTSSAAASPTTTRAC